MRQEQSIESCGISRFGSFFFFPSHGHVIRRTAYKHAWQRFLDVDEPLDPELAARPMHVHGNMFLQVMRERRKEMVKVGRCLQHVQTVMDGGIHVGERNEAIPKRERQHRYCVGEQVGGEWPIDSECFFKGCLGDI